MTVEPTLCFVEQASDQYDLHCACLVLGDRLAGHVFCSYNFSSDWTRSSGHLTVQITTMLGHEIDDSNSLHDSNAEENSLRDTTLSVGRGVSLTLGADALVVLGMRCFSCCIAVTLTSMQMRTSPTMPAR